MDEIERGSIFYDKLCNYYLVITGAIYIDTVKYVCMIFDGYETDHMYLKDVLVTMDDMTDEERFNQVGGIY